MFFKLFSIKINFFLTFPCFCWFFCCLWGVSNRFYGFEPLFCFTGWCVLIIVFFVNGLPKIHFIIKMAVKTPLFHKIIERRFQVLVVHTYSYTYLYTKKNVQSVLLWTFYALKRGVISFTLIGAVVPLCKLLCRSLLDWSLLSRSLLCACSCWCSLLLACSETRSSVRVCCLCFSCRLLHNACTL